MKYFLLSLWRGFRAGMETLGDDLATLINTLLLAVVYLIGVGVTSIVAKLVGKRFLERSLASAERKTPSGASTYWHDIEDEKPELDTYFRQY